jgi:hypothetical protein
MPTSGSNDFLLNRNKLLARALRMVGAIDKGQAVDKKLELDAAIAANCIFKEMDMQFSNLHVLTRATMTLQSGVSTYTTLNGLPNNVNEISTAVFVDSSTSRTTLDIMDHLAYSKIVDRTILGIPQRLYLTKEALTSSRTLYLYPVPQDPKSLEIDYYRRIFDLDSQSDDLDFPPEAYTFLVFRLAADLAEEFNTPDVKAQRLFDRSRLLFQDLRARMAPKMTNYPLLERKYF